MAADPDVARPEQLADLDDDLFELDDPEINLAAMMAQIRERIREQCKLHDNNGLEFPTFESTGYPREPKDVAYDAILYRELRLVNETFAARDTGPVLAPSSATRVPVLGRLWETIRGQAHSLVLFYVNRSVGQQVMVDRHIVSILNHLTAQVESQQREIAGLRQELARVGAPEDA